MTVVFAAGVLVWLVGLSIGSFLNVVVYRLPRDLSVSEPRRSFCPGCQTPIAWFDNLPVVSWVALAGRCRRCGCAISTQYPIVEAATGLAFVIVYSLIFVDHCRMASPAALPRDAALGAAWLVLAGALIACAAMDIVSYMIDTRITDFAVIAGIVLTALWPRSEMTAPLALSPLAAGAVAGGVVAALRLWRTQQRDDSADGPDAETESRPEDPPKPPRATASRVAFALASIAPLIGLAVLLLARAGDAAWLPEAAGSAPIAGGIAALFLVMVLAAGQPREVDAELHAALEDERPRARRVVIDELLWLTPALLAGGAAYALVVAWPAGGAAWRSIAGWESATGVAPIAGAIYSVFGAVAGAAAGWLVRMIFTLAIGREAFGVGDIFILAAAGACAGWDIALLGFLLAVPISLGGWMLALLFKRSGMIAFGPPLALGFLTALWLRMPAGAIAEEYVRVLAGLWRQQPALLMGGALLVLGTGAAALLLAGLVRRLAERRRPPTG